MNRNDLISHYIRALGLWTVCLAARDRSVRVTVADAPAAAAAATWWVADEAEARALMRAVAIHLPGIETGLAISIADATAALHRAAKASKLALTADAVVQARAAAMERGETFPGYAAYLVKFKCSMLDELAATVRAIADRAI